MKAFLAAVLIASVPALGLAQAVSNPKTATKPATKSKLDPSAQKAVEENTPIDDDVSVDLSPAELEVARKVHVGDMPCELGASVKIVPLRHEGLFLVTTKGHRFRMQPVESRTGAVRLEDPRRGAMWLQLGNKSMLMSQKLGQRLADECQSPAQVTDAEHIKANPLPSILEKLPAVTVAPLEPAGTSTEVPVPRRAILGRTDCGRAVTC